MKLIFKDEYAKPYGVKAIEFTNECKVSRNKNAAMDIDSIEILLQDRVLYCVDTKVVQEVNLE